MGLVFSGNDDFLTEEGIAKRDLVRKQLAEERDFKLKYNNSFPHIKELSDQLDKFNEKGIKDE